MAGESITPGYAARRADYQPESTSARMPRWPPEKAALRSSRCRRDGHTYRASTLAKRSEERLDVQLHDSIVALRVRLYQLLQAG